MDTVDKQLLNLIQSNFPITSEPYKEIGLKLGISESEVIRRITNLKSNRIIRRIGATFDSKKLGYQSTLCAMKVPEERLDEVAKLVNSYPGVTHNYLRNHDYNMWFTLITKSEKEQNDILREMKEKSGITDLLNLPAVRFFKVRVDFRL
ncbi:TPA: Lrp/AsnC family transcriptional regulator [Candidatus Poribacteria bacterium]|nr:Lrp/AsnC family transcriptional regulator [Candidatus Poribacteria bacterium]